ncbi:hypothetical protein DPEC_G00234220 [Dallia pectoralis]|uniref:Uncharacterized protein n=1 Tax=Dallia pectoralis TaxID=75939 RepID=A0ACC2FXN6_DALPE|nr:hypothetical protein DPEC_G00234220 [Dallia pectoralis]
MYGIMEAVVRDFVSPEDLLTFKDKYSAELATGNVTKETTFEYAWCLIRSQIPLDIKNGIVLMDELVHKGTKNDQRDYLFYLAVGNYKLKEYERGLKYIRILLKNEPGNTQARDLEQLIVKALKKDGLVGMAIVGGIIGGLSLGVAGVAALVGMAVAKKL